MSFTTIVSEGNLIPADLLAQIATGEAVGQQPADFGFERSRRLTDEIAAAWADARAFWEAFQRSLRRLRDDDPATTLTRERWIIPLLETLGYQVSYQAAAAVVGNRTYAISHRAGESAAPPIHIEGIRRSLDQRGPAGRPRLSPHALLQEYLNATEHLWGIVTNGAQLRLLRDSSRTVRPVYIEFDLQTMLEGEKFSEFALLFRLLHRTRLPQSGDDAARCLLEQYHQQALVVGGRVREGLRDGVELALHALGTGLLRHPSSSDLRARIAAGQLSELDYYRQLLRLVYRLLFLMVAEERRLVGLKAEDRTGSDVSSSALSLHPLYYEHYSVTRLRRLAESSSAFSERYSDLWLGLLATFGLLEDDRTAQILGISALDGDLFGPQAIPDLANASLDNATLLQAIRALSLYRDPQSKALRRINYAALDVEELGSVYESLLDYRPVIRAEGLGLKAEDPTPSALRQPASFALVSGSERKTTGSYYTRPELVQELIKSALEPVLAERLAAAERDPRANRAGADALVEADRNLPLETRAKVRAILALRVVDPACGSGHFLLAAARRLARELARVRTGEEQPAPAVYRRALRDVIARCIYGVDMNPLAVDLCKVALWLESLEPGKPLSFLDNKIRWGNSLVGATDALVEQGIPDDAYKPVGGDAKDVASAIRKRNKKEREAHKGGQAMLDLFSAVPSANPAAEARDLNAMPDDSVAAVRAKAARYAQLRARGSAWWDAWTQHNLWTAAFFTPLTDVNDPRIITSADIFADPAHVRQQAAGHANALALELGFFHWELEFPDVFAERQPSALSPQPLGSPQPSAFDVVLGNPPWERIKLQEQEHFVDVPEIAQATNKAARERMIAAWRNGDERQRARIAQFDAAKYRAEAESRFVRASGRFPLTAVGDVNTYALFSEHCRNLLSATGRAGIIVPTGIATDDSTKAFFGDLNSKHQLVSFYDFENREKIFADVHSRYKFALLIMGATNAPTRFLFFATRIEHLSDEQRAFALTPDEIALINPNTRTAPVFRTSQDAELTKKIYRHAPVLVNEQTGANPWGVSFLRMFDMSNDSNLFQTAPGDGLLPLYEAKLLHQFTHRWATYSKAEGSGLRAEGAGTSAISHQPSVLPEARDVTAAELADSNFHITPRYYIPAAAVEERLAKRWERGWLLSFRDITNSTNERTAIFSLLPRVGVGHKAPLMFLDAENPAIQTSLFLATVNSLVFDLMARQKVGGTNLAFFILKQLPVLPPSAFSPQPSALAYIVPRVLELVYTAWDMQAFAEDVWAESDETLRAAIVQRSAQQGRSGLYGRSELSSRSELRPDSPRDSFPLPPFIWNDERRARIRAELDAYIARLYGLTRDELRYILDPADVYGPEFPGETFRVLKEKETRLYGEYRTRRLVLEAWDGAEG
jgi:hypothetical protein